MTRNMNPPIPGHALWFEGQIYRTFNSTTGDYVPDGHPNSHYGGCRCGAKPPGWSDVSVSAVKRWHREHKAQIRAGQT